jgi:hypothetical protein
MTSRNALSIHQQRIIRNYMNQYNQISLHIEQLYNMLDEIQTNIINVSSREEPRPTTTRTNPLATNIRSTPDVNPNVTTTTRTNPNVTTTTRTNPLINPITTRTNAFYTDIFNAFLNSNVTVRPTQRQIQNATRMIRFGDITNPLSDTCPISLEPFNENDMVQQLRPCGHIFHTPYFNQWFNSNVRCPVCRYDIRNFNRQPPPNSPNSNDQNSPDDPNSLSNDPNSPPNDPNSFDEHHEDEEHHEGEEHHHEEQPQPTNNSSSYVPDSSSYVPDSSSYVSNNINYENINYVRDPITNEIDHMTFDFIIPNNGTITNDLLASVTTNVFQSLLNIPLNQNPSTQNPLNQNPLNQNQNPLNQNPSNLNPLNQNPLNQNPLNQNPLNQNPLNPNQPNQNHLLEHFFYEIFPRGNNNNNNNNNL